MLHHRDGRIAATVVADPIEMAAYTAALAEKLDLVVEKGLAARPSPKKESAEADRKGWEAFCSRVHNKPTQRKVIDFLKTNHGEHAMHELASKLGFEGPVQISGVIGGIRRNTIEAHLDANDAIARSSKGRYSAGRLLKRFDIMDPTWEPVDRYTQILENAEQDDEP